jgi:hypothetical protein
MARKAPPDVTWLTQAKQVIEALGAICTPGADQRRPFSEHCMERRRPPKLR